MHIRTGCRFDLQLAHPTPMIALISVHPSRERDLVAPNRVETSRDVPVTTYLDAHGNLCARLVAPVGQMSLTASAMLHDTGLPDPVAPMPGSTRSRICRPRR